ncbi:SphA family protein [Algibacter mikhailovii]|uniref:SphA family protein n=1 Tax=Algibacter mikhailovii TaxID=425498 RepID=UPI00249519B5|nr:transporter [Algibacter mikhailovii]
MNILILFDFFKLSALKYLHLILFVIANCFNLLGQVSPYQSGAYLPGISGVRDLTYPEFEGLTLIDYNLGLWANKLTDHNGDPLKINQVIPGFEDSEISVKGAGYINSLMISYTSKPIKFLGNARYMAWINPSFLTVNVRVKNFSEEDSKVIVKAGDSGFGDLNIAPLYLSWQGKRLDFTAGYLFSAPTGRYDSNMDDNIGIGYWSHIFQAAAYYYLAEKSTAFMISPVYEIHSKISDTNVKPGARFALEYGISQYFTERLEVTLQGGHVWQISEDKGEDVYWNRSYKDQLSTIGIGIGFWAVPNRFYGNLKWSKTYATKQNFIANALELQLIFTAPFI